MAFLVVVGTYAFQFWEAPISNDPGNWGTFGDYVGGALNPILSLITIVLVLHSLAHNEIVIREAREEASKDQAQSSLVAILEAHAALLNHHEAQLSRLTRERDVRIHDSFEAQVERNEAISNIEKLVFAERAIVDSLIDRIEKSIPDISSTYAIAGDRVRSLLGKIGSEQ